MSRIARPRLMVGAALALAATLAATSMPAFAQTNLERRVDRLEQRLEGSALMGLMNQAETLRQEVSTLRGEVEQLQRQIDDLRDQQRQIYLDVDGRLQTLENGGGNGSAGTGDSGASAGDAATGGSLSGGSAGGTDGSGSAAGTASGGPDSTGDAEASSPGSASGTAAADQEAAARRDYDSAFETLRAGRYQEAAEAFRRFVADHPESALAANARYWLGESYYVVRDFDAALPEFQQVIDNYPESNKRPDALLKIGFVYFEQGRMEEARTTLERVVADFPDTTAANLAQRRLNQI